MYDKNIIFCPLLINEINYTPGSHHCYPKGFSNKYIIGPKSILLHFKFILCINYILFYLQIINNEILSFFCVFPHKIL